MGQLKNTGEICEECGSPLIIAFRNRRAWKFCPKMDCKYNKSKGAVLASDAFFPFYDNVELASSAGV